MDLWAAWETTIEQMVQTQQASLLALARRIVPSLTSEDILQPNDYPELENHPEFRYEEGVLAGMQSLQSAYRYLKKRQGQ
jgi:hypothetical protein